MSGLPEGFVLDEQEPSTRGSTATGLPPGFELDSAAPEQSSERGDGIVDALTDPQQYKEFGKQIPGGVISTAGTAIQGVDVAGRKAQSGSSEFGRQQLEVMDRIDRGEEVREVDDAIGYQHMSPDQRSAARAELAQAQTAFNPTPIAERPLYRAGEAVKEFGQNLIPPAPGYEKSVGAELGRGMGSLVAGLPAAMLGGPVGGGAFFATLGAGEATNKAVEFDKAERKAGRPGLTQDQIVTAGLLGVGPGSTDIVPVEMLLGQLKVPMPVRGAVASGIARIGTQAFVEGIQEGGQQFLQNLIAREVYKPDQKLGEDVVPSSGTGAGVGGIAQATKETAEIMLRLIGRRGGRVQQPKPGAEPAAETSQTDVPEGAVPSDVVTPAAQEPPEAPVAPEPGAAPPTPIPPHGTLARAVERGRSAISEIEPAAAEEMPPQAEGQDEAAQPPADAQDASDPIEDWAGRIIGVESGGNPNAANPNSSALGLGQFTERTWLQELVDARPDLLDGRSRADLLALRTDPQLAREITAHHTRKNAAALADGGIEPTAGSVYLAHFLGLGGALKVLRADPATPVAQLLDPKAIAANRSILEGKTAGQVAQWASAKMDGAAGRASSRMGTAASIAPTAEASAEDVTRDTVANELPLTETAEGDGTRAAPAQIETAEDVARAGAVVDSEPTEAQKAAGNYRKAHIKVDGLDVSIENPQGSIRSGISAEGTPWSVTMPAAYGYVKGSTGKDGDQVDVYIGPEPKSGLAFVIDQFDPKTGKFDEHKVMLGFTNEAEAISAYDAAFSDGSGPSRRRAVSGVGIDEFKTWLKDGNTKREFAVTAPKRQAPKRSGQPLSLLEFLAKNGGIDPKDPLAVDVRTILGMPNRFVPGYGMLIRPTGKSLDNLREAAVEAGYLADVGRITGGEATSTINDLLDLVDRQNRGEDVYSENDREEIARRQESTSAKEQEELLARTIDEAHAIVRESGGKLTDEEARKAAELSLVNNTDLSDAVVEVIEQSYYAAEADLLPSSAKEPGDAEDVTTATDARGDGAAQGVQQSRLQGEQAPGSAAPRGEPRGGERDRSAAQPRVEEPARPAGDRQAGARVEAVAERPAPVARDTATTSPPSNEAEKINTPPREATIKARETGPSDSAAGVPSADSNGTQKTPSQLKPVTDSPSAALPTKKASGDKPMFALRPTEGPRAQGIPAGASEPVATFRNDRPLKAHPDYKAAKAGDKEAAARLVEALVKPENLAAAREKFGEDVTYVPVIAEEMTGHNAIPGLLAELYAAAAGASTTQDIYQSNQAHHTGAKAMERLAVRAEFSGAVNAGARYVLIDDVSVMGSTLAELANHIRQNGGEIAGVAVLVNASRSGVLSPSRARVRAIERRFGDAISDIFGIEPAGLTADEADYVLNFATVDALRSRSASAFGERAERLREKGVLKDEAGGQVAKPKKPDDDGGAPPGAASDSGPRFSLSDAEPDRAPTFYSAVERAIGNVKLSKAPAIQWLNTLRNVPGVKQEEMEWLGLPDWLKEQQGAVTRDAVLEYVRANQIEIQEVEKRDFTEAPDWTPEDAKRWLRLNTPYSDPEEDFGFANPRDYIVVARQHWEAQQNDGDLPGRTRYSGYQLPGGENYRELLLTLPKTQPDGHDVQAVNDRLNMKAVELMREFGDDWRTSAPKEVLAGYEKILDEFNDIKQRRNEPTDFKSSHWDEPNILAHVRFGDRVIDGKRTLFIEEVQSDWHQAGKRRGYRQPVEVSDERRAELLRERDKFAVEAGRLDRPALRETAEGEAAWVAAMERITKINDELGEFQGSRVPDAPFKTTWPELALKRMIRYAAENGYDMIAWTPGDVQADRYDLSKKISRVRYEQSGTSGFTPVDEIVKNAGGTLTAYDHSGRAVISQYAEVEQLPDLIGKGATEKLLAQKLKGERRSGMQFATREISGLDIKVGGEGMSGFYDQILPAAVNKLVKKFGTRVDQAKLDTGEEAGEGGKRWAVVDATDQGDGEIYGTFGTRDAAERYQEEEFDGGTDIVQVPAGKIPVHALDITPQLRDVALGEGFPLFKTGDAAATETASDDAVRVTTSIFTPDFERRSGAVYPAMRAELDRIGLGNVGLKLADEIAYVMDGRRSRADGMFHRDLIVLTLKAKPKLLHHEALHALRKLGAFGEGEWSILERASNAKWRKDFHIDKSYAGFPDWVKQEEGIAHAYAAWADGEMKVDGQVARLFKRIRDILEAIGNALRGAGFKSAESIFRDIKSGAIGKRGKAAKTVNNRQNLTVTAAAFAASSGDSDLFKTEVVQTPDGPRDQLVIPGAEKITDKQRAEREGAKPKRSRKPQKTVDGLPLFDDEPSPDLPLFALKQEPETAVDRQRVSQGLLARGQYLDRAVRMPFDIFGGVNDKGEWKPGAKLFDKAASLITTAKFSPEGRFAFVNPVMEVARAGLVDRYGLDPSYVDRERQRSNDERAVLLQAQSVLKSLKDHGVGAAEAKVLQAILTGEAVSDRDMAGLAEPIRAAIDQLGQEAVALGLVSAESYERNRATYLHRVYRKYEADQNGLNRMVNSVMGGKRKKIIGNQFKGRGIFEEVTVDRLMRDVKEFHDGARGRTQKGETFVRLDEMPDQAQLMLDENASSERPLRTVYLPAERAIPDRYEGFRNQGVWEVRGQKGGKIVLWRDFTKAEREKMGEILDARYTIAKTFMLMAHDLSVGKFYKDIAENEGWAHTNQPNGRWLEAPEWQRQHQRQLKRGDIEWVKVPDVEIPDSGGKKRWGALSGKWVREEIWRDLNELDIMQNPHVWRSLLTQWKLNKTARSPVVHMNNVMSNFVLMDMIDVRAQDFVRGLRSYAKGDAHYQEALANGAFGADMISQEIRDNVLKPVLDEIMRDNTFAQPGRLGMLGQVTKLTELLWSKVKWADRKMRDAYSLEDEIFRMATYIRRREMGDSAKQAATVAREQFLDYDIRAPWVNMARNSVLPFISYTYRAVPLVARAIATRPWKLAKYFLLAYLANSLAYTLTGDDDEDKEKRAKREARERRSLREQEQGKTWIGTERMTRMPFNDQFGNPIFLDVRRWVPAGDVFDTQGNDIPAWLNLGGPLMIGAELFLNRNAFTGNEIVNSKTDDFWDRMGKRGDHLYKSWMPSAAYVPNSWYWEKIANAMKGATDRQGRPYDVGTAVASSVGIKLKPQDVQDGFALKALEFRRIERELSAEARRLSSRFNRKMISEAEFNRAMNDIIAKRQRLSDKATETFKD